MTRTNKFGEILGADVIMVSMSGEPSTLPRLGPLGRLLLSLSVSQRPIDEKPDPRIAVENFDSIMPGIVNLMRGSHVLDIGCGTGALAIGLARRGCTVVGVDIQEHLLEEARSLAGDTPVHFTRHFEAAKFDWVVSVNSMEHFANPLAMLRDMRSALTATGRIVVTFCPTWFAPYGAHMHFFTKVPWVHLLFPERTVLAVRARFINDGAMRYEDVTGGLNRMTVRRFYGLVREANLTVATSRVDAVRALPLVHIPLLGELFANRVTAVLVKTSADARLEMHGVVDP